MWAGRAVGLCPFCSRLRQHTSAPGPGLPGGAGRGLTVLAAAGQLCRLPSVLGAGGLPGAYGRDSGGSAGCGPVCRDGAAAAGMVPAGPVWGHDGGLGPGVSPGPRDGGQLWLCWFPARVGCAAGSAAVFRQVRTQWGRWQMPAPARCWSWACARWSGSGFGSGPGVCGFLACMGDGDGGLPTVALCGLAVDLSRITSVPVTPALCAGFLCGSLLARRSRILPFLCPALWSLPAMYVAGTFDPHVFLGLGVGGLAGGSFRPGPARKFHRGSCSSRRWQAAWRRLPGS